ncbi:MULTISPECIES: AzlD domain-containing protein [unclassified Paracoccus (in: a-proteobacteria)]|uniref:AzlD domain-containing protein n=1 Tax=unclassified Paracoccus (in: a-proteobacteria) TaxID=2688777 RepID=UPI001604495B|nr:MULTISPECIES: AzlD domain-containing protein [unclassified Paracoccus (in: a-proteobacteria)]MBB1492554.1 AzlD domain-containing protein [Paracoccus sp. MC1854]MBB1498378.1 AzlD domain-containing protein [Paracoccus sp. MC1862]QQO44413.1 AzlD domain-containing protein [Paracoccus sp. MC1862]
MQGYSDATIWLVIVALGIGTFLLRWSFLGVVGDRPVPEWAQRILRYTAVSVLPAMVAPLVLWPAATGGQPDPVRLAAAGATVALGLLTRNTLWAIIAGGAVLGFGTWLA